MDPLPVTLTEYSQWNDADTPRTYDLNYLRAKRVAYYESVGIINTSRNGCQPLSTISQDTEVCPSDYQIFGPRYPHSLTTGRKSLLEEETRQVPQEMEKNQNPRVQGLPGREDCPEGLDLHFLANALVPETQKLHHVINWAQKFLSNSLEEHDLKRLQKSLELSQSSPCQSSKALGNHSTTQLRSSDYQPRDDQLFNAQAHIPSFFLHPPKDLSEIAASSDSILKEGFPVRHSDGWQEVRNEGDGRPDSPDSLQQDDSPQEKSDRAGNSGIQSISEEEPFPEKQVVLSQSVHTSGGNTVLEHESDYFWAPLSDSSEEEDELGESQEVLRRVILGRNYRVSSGIAFPSAGNSSTLVSNCTTLSGGVSFSGETSLETAVKEACRGAAECPMGPGRDISEEFQAGSPRGEHLIQRLHRDQFMCFSHHYSGKRKDSGKVEFAVGPAHTARKHKGDWKLGFMESPGDTVKERVPGGELDRTACSSAQGSSPGIIQKHSILGQPENCLSAKSASLLLNVSEGSWDNAAPHTHSGSGVCCGLWPHAAGVGRSTWFDQLPSPVLDGQSRQTLQGVSRKTTQEQKEKELCSNHSISGDISKTSLKGSFTPQNVGTSVSWSDEPLPSPDQRPSVLETYFYYLKILDIRGVASEERCSSLPSHGPSTTKPGPVVTSPVGPDLSSGIKMDREAKGQRKGKENDVSVEGKRDI